MNELTFANPAWLWGGLILVPLIALRVWSHWHASRKLPGLVSPKLMGVLVNGSSRSQRWTVFVLRCFAIAGIFTALARPQIGFEEIETESKSRSLIIAIDTSRSMLAPDLTPDRLTRAKLAAKDIVSSLPADRIGVMAFAGRPFLQAPLTVDHQAVIESIDQLDTEIIPRGGTNLAAAAEMALETFKESKLDQGTLVIFSDGEALEGSDQLADTRAAIAEAGMSVVAVGVGTRDGSIIPEIDDRGMTVPGKFIKDDDGQVVRSRLDPTALQELSSGNGFYLPLDGKASLSRVVAEIEKGIATSREESGLRRRPIERFMWPLAFSLICLIVSHFAPLLWLKPAQTQSNWATTTAATSVLLLLFVFTPQASLGKDALMSGYEALENEDYESAVRTYEGALVDRTTKLDRAKLQMGLGAASYRQGQYDRAAEAYGQALLNSNEGIQELAHYNLGNTLFKQGESGLTSMQRPSNPDQLQSLSATDELVDSTIRQWEGAIEHYETALAMNEQNQQAAHNLEFVKKRLEELKNQQQEQQEQEQQQQDQQNQEQDEQKQEEQEQNQENQSDSQNEDQQQENQEQQQNQQGDQQESSQEDQQQPENEEKESQSENEEQSENGEERQDSGQNSDPNQNQPPPPQEQETPQEGQLGTNANRQPPPNQANQIRPEDLEQNPETGYTPNEARQLLEALSDETEVKPALMPSGNDIYKNW